ncbi:hypothetical protein ACQ4LE_002902 [Meloidogyne hapla]
MSNNISFSRSEIEACQEAVKNFRVQELQQLVASFKYPKIGKKHELVGRALSLLTNPRYQPTAVAKVHEIQASNRVRDSSQPYPSQPERGLGNQQLNGTMSNNQMHSNQQSGIYGFNAAAPGIAQFPGGFGNFMNYAAAYGQQFQGATAYQPNNFSQSLPAHNQPHYIPPQHSQGGLVRNLRTVELPFYDLFKVVVPMTELPSYPVPTRPGEGRFSCTFGLPADDIAKLTYPEDQKLPRYELQLRMFLLENSEEQPDAFPPGSAVRLDDFNVNLPAIIPTNKPNAEHKRYSRPVNITPYCRPPRSKDRPHRLNFEWNGDKRAWAFTVLLVKRVNSDILLERIRNNPNASRPASTTRDNIIRRLSGDEDDVQMDACKISLVDPLGRMRIKIPSRAADCTHLQTFDLYNYLMMNEKRPGWKCPVCDKNAIYSKLVIDKYFEDVLKTVGSSVEEVELLRDGSWGLPKANDTISLCSDEDAAMADADDDDIMIVDPAKTKPSKTVDKKKSDSVITENVVSHQELPQPTVITSKTSVIEPKQQRTSTSSNTSNAPKKKVAVPEEDIIELSSDDEDDRLATAISVSQLNDASAAGTPNSNASGGAGGGGGGSVTNNIGHSSQSHATRRGGVSGTGGSIHNDTRQSNGYNSSTSNTSTSSATPPFLHNNNGQLPGIFRPPIDEVAKTQIAQSLANFLQNVYTKNNRSQQQCGPPFRSS